MKYIVSRFEKCVCRPGLAPGTCGHPVQPTQDMSSPFDTRAEAEQKLRSLALFVTQPFEFRVREVEDQPGPQSNPQWLEDLKGKSQSGVA